MLDTVVWTLIKDVSTIVSKYITLEAPHLLVILLFPKIWGQTSQPTRSRQKSQPWPKSRLVAMSMSLKKRMIVLDSGGQYSLPIRQLLMSPLLFISVLEQIIWRVGCDVWQMSHPSNITTMKILTWNHHSTPCSLLNGKMDYHLRT